MQHPHLKNTGVVKGGGASPPEKSPKSVEDREVTLPEFEKGRDLLEEFLSTPLNPSYASPKTGRKISVDNAMVVMQPSETRDTIVDSLRELNLDVSVYDHFELIFATEYQKADLMMLDVRQGDYHAVDLLHILIRDEALSPTRFAIVGRNPADVRQQDWKGLGKGLFLREKLPTPWVKKTLAEWLTEKMEPEEANPGILKQPLVAVIDDDTGFVEAFKEALSMLNYRVICADNGVEGVKMVRKMKPDVVLMDVDMPQKSGIEALRTLRVFRSTEQVAVIMMTAHREEAFLEEARGLGIQDYMLKPLDLEQVHKQIQHALAAKEWE